MHPTSDPGSPERDACQEPLFWFERIRSHVLNVLVAVGLSIALSGWLLRARAANWQPRPAETLSNWLYAGLIALAATSYIARRILGIRAARAQTGRRDRLFYWSHVGPAALAALAVPLGLAYGWLVSPRLDAIAPFWAVAFALGFLSLPRRYELIEQERTSSHRESASK
jgi:hypothetical protein